METKVFEIRDEGTHISGLAIRFCKEDSRSFWRAGYSGSGHYVVLVDLMSSFWQSDPEKWANRTLRAAHHLIIRDWDNLPNGCVVDARVYLGLRETPVESDFVQ